jgi:hypothetical protein
VRRHGGVAAERGDPEHMVGPAAAVPERPVVVGRGPGPTVEVSPDDQLRLL